MSQTNCFALPASMGRIWHRFRGGRHPSVEPGFKHLDTVLETTFSVPSDGGGCVASLKAALKTCAVQALRVARGRLVVAKRLRAIYRRFGHGGMEVGP
jgi:hypothetical protein